MKKKVYKFAVPNQRASGQKQVIVIMQEEFLNEIDSNLAQMGFGDRAQFIRTAAMEKLQKQGIGVTCDMIAPPSRIGKGGRPKSAATAMLNDDESPSPAPEQKPVSYAKKRTTRKPKK